jgi:hypothetical protein
MTPARPSSHARLAMDAQPQFDLILAQHEAGAAGCRHGAGRDGHPHGPHGAGGRAGGGRDLGQRGARLRHRAGDLVDKDGTGQPPPAGVPGGPGQGHVVGHQDGLDRDPLGPGQLGRQPEVQSVARVVLDDQDRAARAGRGAHGGEDGVGGRRGEDVAGDGGRSA